MTWKQFFTSSIGKKFIMGLTGLFLISFLVVHCTINSMIFFNDGGEMFNTYAHFMSHNYIIRVIEGPLALVPCVSRTAYKRCKDCKDEAMCEIRLAMMDVRDDTARILDGRSLADAVAETKQAA